MNIIWKSPFFIVIRWILIIFSVLESWKFVFFGFPIFENIHVDSETTAGQILLYIQWADFDRTVLRRYLDRFW